MTNQLAWDQFFRSQEYRLLEGILRERLFNQRSLPPKDPYKFPHEISLAQGRVIELEELLEGLEDQLRNK